MILHVRVLILTAVIDFIILYVPGTDAFLSIRHISYVVAVESTGACMYTLTCM